MTCMTKNIATSARERSGFFARAESGGITVLNVFMLMVICILGGVAVDVANLVAARTQLQVAADAAAHAALMTRDRDTADNAKAKGIEVALANMPVSRYGTVLRTENIHFGTYDKTTKQFTIDNTSSSAVYVATDRLGENANAVSAFLLQFAGFWNFDIVTSSVFETFRPECLNEGFVADDVVDIQSNNTFLNQFCIHSNEHVSLNQGNYFETGVNVSMPHLEDLDIPAAGMTGNTGLAESLRERKYTIKILNRLDDIRDGLNVPGSDYYRSYLTDNTVIYGDLTSNNNTVDMSYFTSGHIYNLTCTRANGSLTLDSDTYDDIAIITNCPINFSNGTVLQDVTIFSENTDVKSMDGGELTLGEDDNCSAGGGTQLITRGGISTSANWNIFGSQVIAAGDVKFAAQADGIEGASIIAGGTIDGPSLISMALCGSGNEANFGVNYFRMAG